MWKTEAPASEEKINSLTANCNFALPPAYLDLLRLSNGGEGDIPIEPGWFRLWKVEEVIQANKDYKIAEYAPGFFAFGSNGGGEMFAFRIEDVGRWSVYIIPFIGSGEEDAIKIAETFEIFKNLLSASR